MIMNEPKLLPCPFCGGQGFFTNDSSAPQFIYARCSCCQARTASFFRGIDNGKNYEDSAYEQAVEKWNRRQPIRNAVLGIIEKAFELSAELNVDYEELTK